METAFFTIVFVKKFLLFLTRCSHYNLYIFIIRISWIRFRNSNIWFDANSSYWFIFYMMHLWKHCIVFVTHSSTFLNLVVRRKKDEKMSVFKGRIASLQRSFLSLYLRSPTLFSLSLPHFLSLFYISIPSVSLSLFLPLFTPLIMIDSK